MAWTTPITFLVGQVITAANFNTYVRDNENNLHDSTWFKIVETILSGTATNITFSSLNSYSMFQNLLLIGMLRSDTVATSETANIIFNNDTSTNYSFAFVDIDGAGNTHQFSILNNANMSICKLCAANAPASSFTPIRILITNFASAKHKTVDAMSGLKTGTGANTNLLYQRVTGWWQSTSAVTSLAVRANTNNFVTGSYLSLYGVS